MSSKITLVKNKQTNKKSLEECSFCSGQYGKENWKMMAL